MTVPNLALDDIITEAWVDAVSTDVNGVTSAWSSYSPTDANITVGNGSQSAFWKKVGRTIHFTWSLTLGSSSSIGTAAAVGLPEAAAGVRHAVAARYNDTGTREWVGAARIASSGSTAVLLHTESGNAGVVSATAPHTWAATDEIVVTGTYFSAT